jgi:hypothetical protein
VILLKLKEFNFSEIQVRGLVIFVDGKQVESGFIGEVLKKIPHLAEKEIKETNTYFDEFIVRL